MRIWWDFVCTLSIAVLFSTPYARTLCVLCVYFAHEIAWVLSDLVADATSYKLCGRSDLLM